MKLVHRRYDGTGWYIKYRSFEAGWYRCRQPMFDVWVIIGGWSWCPTDTLLPCRFPGYSASKVAALVELPTGLGVQVFAGGR